VVTVAAIFFALTVGLVVGSLFVSPRVADRQERALVDLRKTFNSLSLENKEKTQQIAQYKECLNSTLPLAIRGKLTGVTVALIQTGDYPDARAGALEALQQAGAHVVSQTTIEQSFARPDEALLPNLAALHTQDMRFPSDREGLADALASILAQGDSLIAGLMPSLEKEGFVQAEAGSDYVTPVRYVVIVAGRRTPDSLRPGLVDLPLVKALQKRGMTVVACEPEESPASDIAAYHDLKLDLATVDNIDSEIGRCALVFALVGEKDDYGVKPTARHLLPPIPAKQN
jgi:hypothetical protein